MRTDRLIITALLVCTACEGTSLLPPDEETDTDPGTSTTGGTTPTEETTPTTGTTTDDPPPGDVPADVGSTTGEGVDNPWCVILAGNLEAGGDEGVHLFDNSLTPVTLVESADSIRMSPDGRRFAHTLGAELWIYDLDDMADTMITSDLSSDFHWAPGGGHLAFVAGTELHVATADGADTFVADDPIPLSITWSGTGSALGFVATDAGTGMDAAWAYDPDADELNPVEGMPGATEVSTSIAPCGDGLVYRIGEPGMPADLTWWAAQTGTSWIAAGMAAIDNVECSPDGSQVVWNEGPNLFGAPSSGDQPAFGVANNGSGAFKVSSDGTRVVTELEPPEIALGSAPLEPGTMAEGLADELDGTVPWQVHQADGGDLYSAVLFSGGVRGVHIEPVDGSGDGTDVTDGMLDGQRVQRVHVVPGLADPDLVHFATIFLIELEDEADFTRSTLAVRHGGEIEGNVLPDDREPTLCRTAPGVIACTVRDPDGVPGLEVLWGMYDENGDAAPPMTDGVLFDADAFVHPHMCAPAR